MFEYVREALYEIEASISTPSLKAVLPRLRSRLGLDDFGELMWSMPLQEFPKLSQALPRMASTDVQTQWTGAHGLSLLRQSANFVRSATYNYTKLSGRLLDRASILDYGCGYGRLARLMYYFTDPENLFGVDPWDRSIEICHEDGLDANFRLSEYLPESLPLPRGNFDFIYAFSVFTHLSLRATWKALEVCRRYIASDGVMLITIRPIEYWDLDTSIHGLRDISPLHAAHREQGFAFSPHNRPAVDGDITYGDTSMTFEWIEANFPQWRITTVDHSLEDAFQIYVFVQPR
jgi:SAM-dependent methyltransferase